MGLLLGKLQNSGDQKKKEYEKLENNFDDHVTVDMISGLPDDVTIDVLSRLPAEQVWELGKVSKRVFDLISSPDFASKLHLEKSPSIAFLQYIRRPKRHGYDNDDCSCWPWRWSGSMEFFYLDDHDDDDVGLVNGSPLLQNLPTLVASCNGLLLFEKFSRNYSYPIHYYIWNPITQQVVSFNTICRIYGLYYHSSTKEYRLLYLLNSHLDEYIIEYGIIKAGEKAGRRLYFQEADQGHIPCPREGLGEPSQVVVKNFLYWMAHTSRIDNAIIAFDTESEIFFTLPCPNYELGDPSTPNNFPIAFSGMRLFEMEGRLTCWFLGVEFGCVWFLDDIDDENRSNIPNWTLKCHLNLSRDFSEYPFYSSNSGIRLLRYQNKELLLVWGGRGVFRYNLSTWKVKKVEEFNRIYYSQDNIDLVAMGHTKSVVFLDDQVRGRCIYFERPDRSHWLEDEVKQD